MFGGRLIPVSFRNGPVTAWPFRTRLRPILYGVALGLLVAVVVLSQRQFSLTGMDDLAETAAAVSSSGLPSLVIMPGRKIVQLRAEAEPEGESRTGAAKTPARKKVMGFVGIQTGFESVERRRALRETWLPGTREGRARLEAETGLAFRFVIGTTGDADREAALEREAAEHGDFMRMDNEEEYRRLPVKTLAFFRAAHALFDADFYVKADDDIYLRPDRLALLLRRPRRSSRTYLGCMKKGTVISNNASKWYEPRGYLLGVEYFAHAYGNIYALSREVVSEIAALPSDSMRLFSNEDVMVGAWMLAFNVRHEDDRSLCHTECRPDSIAVWDMPTCSGLCEPEKQLRDLHAEDMCARSPADPNAGPVKALEDTPEDT